MADARAAAHRPCPGAHRLAFKGLQNRLQRRGAAAAQAAEE
ncbi:hypothetical protein [Streptomyces kaempferi]|uniref:Uncharacterized protein n=1 Tax=Streptomyces kaempferi TaxID=333725 RepID=A0ABW3XXI2_9ACTN